MCLSNKEMDEAEERAQASNQYAIEHASDNSASHVYDRYVSLYGQHQHPVPLRQGASINAPMNRLFPIKSRGTAYNCRTAPSGNGIIVRLRDETTDEVADYQVEINGLNGVEVTRKV